MTQLPDRRIGQSVRHSSFTSVAIHPRQALAVVTSSRCSDNRENGRAARRIVVDKAAEPAEKVLKCANAEEGRRAFP